MVLKNFTQAFKQQIEAVQGLLQKEVEKGGSAFTYGHTEPLQDWTKRSKNLAMKSFFGCMCCKLDGPLHCERGQVCLALWFVLSVFMVRFRGCLVFGQGLFGICAGFCFGLGLGIQALFRNCSD